MVERGGEAAGLGSTADAEVMPAAPLDMEILGRVREQRQPIEGSDHVDHLFDRLRAEYRFEIVNGTGAAATPGDCDLADRLDEVEGGVTRLVSYDVSEEAAEQADVVAERFVSGRRARGRRVWGVLRFCGRGRHVRQSTPFRRRPV